MTVPSTTARNTYTGTGATATYAYGFEIFDQTHLLVKTRASNNAETTLVLTTDYTVAGVSEAAGGTITLVAGNLASGVVLLIRRNVPLTQATDISNQGAAYAETVEDEMDRMVMRLQQIQDQVDRCIKLKETETGTAALTEVPAPATERASKVLSFDASGNPTVVTNVPTGSLVVSAYGETLLDDGDAATARTTLGFTGAGSTVATGQLEDGSVTTPKIAALAVTAAKVAVDAIATTNIQALAVTAAKIADLTITGAKIAAGTITSDKLSSTLVTPQVFQARLTTVTGNAVPTTDQAAITTLYLTPYGGNRLALYDGTGWTQFALTEISTSVPATTSTMYDIFVYDAPGLTLEAVAWTNDTTRATALAKQDGVYVKTGQLTRRYVGSFRTTGVAGQTEDSLTKRYVTNYYNQKPRPLRAVDTTDSWTYSTAAYRQARASTANQLDLIIGVDETMVSAEVQALASTNATNRFFWVGVGLDSTVANSAQLMSQGGVETGNQTGEKQQLVARYKGHVGVGRHFLAWLERGDGNATTTWYGDNAVAFTQSGIHGEVMG